MLKHIHNVVACRLIWQWLTFCGNWAAWQEHFQNQVLQFLTRRSCVYTLQCVHVTVQASPSLRDMDLLSVTAGAARRKDLSQRRSVGLNLRMSLIQWRPFTPRWCELLVGRPLTVASLGLVSPGAATDGVTLVFSWKIWWPLFSHRRLESAWWPFSAVVSSPFPSSHAIYPVFF